MDRRLGSTEVLTTPLGLGCAGLFRLASASDRRRVLDAAFDAGVKHFDVAPMYGLGRAEFELGRFARRRRSDVVIATKFGIDPTVLGQVAGRVQGPVRAVLRRVPQMQAGLQESGRGPTRG